MARARPHPSPVHRRLLSLSGLFALFCFALLQAAVASVRFRGVHVSPRVHSLVGALLRLALVPTVWTRRCDALVWVSAAAADARARRTPSCLPRT